MSDLLFKVILSAGTLAVIYRLYLAFTNNQEAKLESKNAEKVKSDLDRNAEDAKTIKESTDSFNDAVDIFRKRNK